MIYENNEEKRSTIWRTILTVSSVLIIIIAAFFIIKLFTGNPLEGTWISEDSGAVLEIGDDGELTLKEAESGEVQNLNAYTEGILSGSYDYNVEQNTLTLTEREYGDQMVFERSQK